MIVGKKGKRFYFISLSLDMISMQNIVEEAIWSQKIKHVMTKRSYGFSCLISPIKMDINFLSLMIIMEMVM